MSDQFSAIAERIRALGTSLVSLLQTTRDEGVPVKDLRQMKVDLAGEYQKFLNEGAKELSKGREAGSECSLGAVEAAYATARAIDAAFRETLSLAYSGSIPRANLLIDDDYAEFRRRTGDPLAALHTRLHSLWADYLEGRPWDAHLSDGSGNADAGELGRNLHSLVHGDHLDLEDALASLAGPLRYAFADYMERTNEPLELMEESLWLRPEILLINDYWQYHPHVRLLDLIRRKSRTKYAGAFARLQGFFSESNSGADDSAAERVVEEVRKIRAEERDPYIRCLMLHPDRGIRSYAVTNTSADSFWKMLTPDGVPLMTILSMLEKISGSKRYEEDFQKVFFHAIHRRLLSVGSRSEVVYARGIVRILAEFPFFMEDLYFEKLTTVVDYLSAKEKHHGMEGGVLDEYIWKLRREKNKIGVLQADSPSIANIPAVVLRKLARDGHFWFELSSHPLYKIARETVRHINTSDRALRVASNHVSNSDVLREIGRNRGLFGTRSAKFALLTNPRTPPAISLEYLPDLSRQDQKQLLHRSTMHPELRRRVLERVGT